MQIDDKTRELLIDALAFLRGRIGAPTTETIANDDKALALALADRVAAVLRRREPALAAIPSPAEIDEKTVEAALKKAPKFWRETANAESHMRALLEAALATLNVDSLAQEIRRVDGNNELGAGALAEALMPFLTTHPSPAGAKAVTWQYRSRLPDGTYTEWGDIASSIADAYRRDWGSLVSPMGGAEIREVRSAASVARPTAEAVVKPIAWVDPRVLAYLKQRNVQTISLFRDEQDGYTAIYTSPPAPAVASASLPDGWVTVPEEPTPEMIDVGLCVISNSGPSDIYRAMIAARPAAPANAKGAE